MTPTRQEVADAVAAVNERDHVMIVRGDTGRMIAQRKPADENCGARLVVLGPIDALLEDGAAPAIRPGADGTEGMETGELDWLSPQRRREVKRERNRAEHALRQRASRRAGTGGANGATSAPHGAPDAGSRPDAAEGATEARTASEVRVI